MLGGVCPQQLPLTSKKAVFLHICVNSHITFLPSMGRSSKWTTEVQVVFVGLLYLILEF